MVRASCPRVGDFFGGMGEWGMTMNFHEWGGEARMGDGSGDN